MTPINHTALHALHLEVEARMVNFSGYEMPLQYAKGIRHEHQHTRTAAGLFDISHMGQIKISGNNIAQHLESLVPSDIVNLKPFQQRYTVFTNRAGGIIDDLMVTRLADALLLVVNAACKKNNFNYLTDALAAGCQVELLTNKSLIALQGPKARTVLAELTPEIDRLGFMQAGEYEIDGIPCLVNCCGYTGEDGFEISVNSEKVEQLSRLLLCQEVVELIGLGARDSLRLEAGLCLYGHEIDAETTPIEAGLDWVIAKKYRQNNAAAGFPGAGKILKQLLAGPEIIRVGLRPEGKIPIREGTTIINDKGDEIGTVTSGGYGQGIGGPIAMGYVEKQYAALDAKLTVVIRGRQHAIGVSKLPFVKHRYARFNQTTGKPK